MGHRVSAGSVPGGPDRRSDLRHPHGQRARGWILPRHHREWATSRALSLPGCRFYFSQSDSGTFFVLAAEFWSLPGHRGDPPGGKPQADGESPKHANNTGATGTKKPQN